MLRNALLIKPSASFWQQLARAFLEDEQLHAAGGGQHRDYSLIRILVPTFSHVHLLKAALSRELKDPFIPPRITTLSAWLDMLPPDSFSGMPQSDSARIMALYAELRQHGWLKKLFSARRNTDLLPLAQTLLALSDELTQTLLPSVRVSPEAAEERWHAALAHLPPSSRSLLSDEAQLVRSIWQSQIDGNDACVMRYARMMRLAEHAQEPLMWVTPAEPDEFHQSFLSVYGRKQLVAPVMLDWGSDAIPAAYSAAWRELPESAAFPSAQTEIERSVATPAGVSLYAAKSLEDEAQCGAQTVIDWLASGKTHIAIVAQDRAVARRIRALLERAQVYVADETGWKLSTTRAAAAIMAWFEVVAARAETTALLDLLKSPYLFADAADKSFQVMAIEIALRNANVLGEWNAVISALAAQPDARGLVLRLADQAELFADRKTIKQWLAVTRAALDALGMRQPLAQDPAGEQVLALFDAMEQDCHALEAEFSFAEWRTFLGLQFEVAPFAPSERDSRVAMLPLNGARLRAFDAVLLVGADAAHLPSRPIETLFFGNAVRRELGLATRESLQRQQLRDFTEMLCANPQVVLSWQSQKEGEPNPVSVWIERLQLALERCGAGKLPMHQPSIAASKLKTAPPSRPAPSAPHLLPRKLSASAYNSFVACPYQFFATRMLGLASLEELSDMPEKRDYGDWLHQILARYHEALRERNPPLAARETLLREITDAVFSDALEKNPAALGYFVRWQNALPAYLEWANERENAGWNFVFGEHRLERLVQWNGGEVTLYGRIDRIDENSDGERAILDYKTRNLQSLRDKLREGEDHQLAFYGLLSDTPVSNAHYVALEPAREKTGDAQAERYAEWQQALREQIAVGMQAISRGAPLPASGIETVCQFCDVRGLCRKGAW